MHFPSSKFRYACLIFLFNNVHVFNIIIVFNIEFPSIFTSFYHLIICSLTIFVIGFKDKKLFLKFCMNNCTVSFIYSYNTFLVMPHNWAENIYF